MGDSCVAIFWPTPGFKGRTFVSSGFSVEETLISSSTIPPTPTLPDGISTTTSKFVVQPDLLMKSVCVEMQKSKTEKKKENYCGRYAMLHISFYVMLTYSAINSQLCLTAAGWDWENQGVWLWNSLRCWYWKTIFAAIYYLAGNWASLIVLLFMTLPGVRGVGRRWGGQEC